MWHAHVHAWFARAASGERPLPPLVITGRAGVGKTHTVRAAAARAGLDVAWYGSEDGVKARRLTASTQMRRLPLTGTRMVLCLDDADTLVTPDNGFAGKDDVLRLAHGAMPVVLCACDVYTGRTPALRQLVALPAATAIVHCRATPLAPDQIVSLLAAAGGGTEPWMYDVAVSCNGDLRRAMLHGQLRLASASTSGVVTASDSPFTQVQASLGVGTGGVRLPDDAHAADIVMLGGGNDQDMCRTLLDRHTAAACPSLSVLADAASARSDADALGHGNGEALWMAVRGIPALVRSARFAWPASLRTTHAEPWTGPPDGVAASAMRDTWRKLGGVAGLLDWHGLRTLQRTGRLAGGPRTTRKTPEPAGRTRALTAVWRAMDGLAACSAGPAAGVLPGPDEWTRLLRADLHVAGDGPVPWHAPKLLPVIKRKAEPRAPVSPSKRARNLV